jgi:ferrochelatase
LVTSAYSSYSACRQYREDIERARAEVGEGAPVIDKVRQFYDHPGFVGPMIDNVRSAYAALPADLTGEARLVCTAHSVPLSMATSSSYVAQLLEVTRLVAEGVGTGDDGEGCAMVRAWRFARSNVSSRASRNRQR